MTNISYDIVLREVPLDEGITKIDCIEMFNLLDNESAIPIEIQGEFSSACGFISLPAAESLNYDYRNLSEFVKNILDDMNKEVESGNYEYNHEKGYTRIFIWR